MTDVADRTEHTGTMTEPDASETTTPEGVRGRRVARWIVVAVLGAVSVVAILFSIDYGLGTGIRPGPGLSAQHRQVDWLCGGPCHVLSMAQAG